MIEDPGYWENMANEPDDVWEESGFPWVTIVAAALLLCLWAGVLKWQDYVKPPTHVAAPEAFTGIGGGGAAGYGKPDEVVCLSPGVCLSSESGAGEYPSRRFGQLTDTDVTGIGERNAPNR